MLNVVVFSARKSSFAYVNSVRFPNLDNSVHPILLWTSSFNLTRQYNRM